MSRLAALAVNTGIAATRGVFASPPGGRTFLRGAASGSGGARHAGSSAACLSSRRQVCSKIDATFCDDDGRGAGGSSPVNSRSSLLRRAQCEGTSECSANAVGRSSGGKELGSDAVPNSDPPRAKNDIDSQRPVCLVVGAGSGIGKAVATRFAQGGYATAVARRSGQTIRDDVQEIRRTGDIDTDVPVLPYQCDAREEDQVLQLFDDVVQTLGRVDVVIYNIGSNISYPIVETSARKFKKCWEMGCFSGFLVGREAARRMLKRNAGGTIIFTGATASTRGAANFSAFSTTKMGLRALAQSMARELGPRGIHVCHVIIDGVVDTPWIRKNFSDALEKLPVDGICKPDEIAELYFQLSRQHRSAWTHEVDVRPYSERF